MSSSSHSPKSMESEVKSLKTLLKEVSQAVQLISFRQLENENKINELRSLKALQQETADEVKAIEVEIIDYMKENNLDTEITDTAKVTYKPQTRTTLDKKRLEEDLGDLTDYEKVTTYNVLRVK